MVPVTLLLRVDSAIVYVIQDLLEVEHLVKASQLCSHYWIHLLIFNNIFPPVNLKYYFLIILNINECDTGTHDCNLNTSTCMNIVGSSVCQCLSGYLGNRCSH